ncbi:glycerophosphodiester phosphodiesterase family protein [Anaerolineales bacterium HSG6]|nr:glycerophosphodiester phosphodiesterase family protein [Anaerolineales bacterium HSG6]
MNNLRWQDLQEKRLPLGRPIVIAHRGASDILPENSPSAFYRAIIDGADMIETDIHFSKDGDIILMHDPTVDRTTHASGAIRDMTTAEIKRCKIRQPKSRTHVDERPYTLPEYIAATGGKIPTALELKDPRFSDKNYAKKLVQTLADYHALEIFGVISFDLTRVQAVQAVYPDIVSGWITLKNGSPNHPVTFVGPFWPVLLMNPLYVRLAHRLGKLVCPLDPWPEKRLGLYRRLQVDMIMTDNPKKTRDALQRME